METLTDFPLEEDVEHSSHKTLRLVDLNYYCLREISNFLDQSSQFAVMQACEIFTPIIVDDLWSRYHETGFNLRKAPAMASHSLELKSGALKIVLQNFKKVTNIPLELLKSFFKDNQNETFNKVEYLSIEYRFYGYYILDTNDFYCFPNLVKLSFNELPINLFKSNVVAMGSAKTIFIRTLFKRNKKTLILMSLPNKEIRYRNFCSISKCDNLRQLTIASEYILHSQVLGSLVNVPSLEILTLETRCAIYFDCCNLNLFNAILEKIHASPKKTLEGIQMNGVPNTTFFCSLYLKGIQKLNWMVKTKPDHILMGNDERSHHLPLVLQYYQRFIESNKYLKTLYVRDNQLYRAKLSKQPQFNEDIQSIRVQQNYPRLNIVNDYTDLPENPYIMDLNEGCMKFICNINN